MQKSNKSIAGYHLLMILSSVDGEFAPAEGLKIQEYLAEEFPFKMNLDNELDAIAVLQPEQWKDHFEFHARCFFDDSTEKERKDFLHFAKSLIKADDEVTEREHHFYRLLKNMWFPS
ncbi:tellurite resistance TerB family protein [Kaistella sp.]|uniref:tellurite resistance TerB family protein n=1 Tax=Kaistella sp. TaxID=2782235 RepID=UPI002F92D0EA